MVSLWITIGLVVATVSVSILGAAFSIFGLAALFSGQAAAVAIMAGALEFAKFVLAAYLHQQWKGLNIVFKSYLTASIIILSIITSMGIFGFLSDAYQSSTQTLDTETVNINALKIELESTKNEIARQNKFIDEIPVNRVTRRLEARAELEPVIAALVAKVGEIQKSINEADLKILEVKQRVGPILYISRAFKMDVDSVVKYLIMILVVVFDPLAICLVLAMTGAIESRKKSTQSVNSNHGIMKMRFADENKSKAG